MSRVVTRNGSSARACSASVEDNGAGVGGAPAAARAPGGHSTVMSLPSGGARWARGGLLAATFAMGGSLVATSLLSYRSVVQASAMLSESQGEALLRSTFLLVRSGQDLPTRSALEALLEEQAGAGLRYVAILDRQARDLVEAGSPLDDRPLDPRPSGDHQPRVALDLGERLRLVAGPPPPPPGAAERPSGPAERQGRLRPTIVIEFEPLMARQLAARAARALAFGAAAAVGLMAVALLFSRQLSRREAAERRLEEQRRLAVLGEMSSVIAHELRNPLASLKGHAQLLAERLPEGGRERSKADRIVLEARRLEALSGDLLDFSRSGPIERREVEPAAVLGAAAESVDAPGILISCAGAPRRFALDGQRMRRALTNLLLNAVQASPAGARVEARAEDEDGALVFTVRDHGAGIPPGDLARVFEPFYTTRATGTGLGLAVTQRIVEMHGGRITAENHPEGGAVFRVSIPKG
jgi:two-component system, NtrC family, sensor histidine kinase HydH